MNDMSVVLQGTLDGRPRSWDGECEIIRKRRNEIGDPAPASGTSDEEEARPEPATPFAKLGNAS